MSYNVYTTALNKMLTAELGNLTSVTVKCSPVTASYVYNATHGYVSDLGASTLGSATLTNLVASNGVLTCDNFTFTGIASGTTTALVYYIDTGNPASSPLLAYDSSATNLPFTFTGADVLVTAPLTGLISLTSV